MVKTFIRIALFSLVTLSGGIACAQTASLGDVLNQTVGKPPPTLDELAIIPPPDEATIKATEENSEIRQEGLREAALSYGARGGLAARSYEIRKTLMEKEAYLDRIYDFKRLLITAPSGLLIEPPVISEAQDAMLIESDGQTAAVADTIYNINVDAKIVAAPRNWRAYLERDWGDVTPPPAILYPTNDEEKAAWLVSLRKGWDEGVKQADEVFQADLDRLNADFRGMIRYRMLLAQGIVSAPYTLQTDRGVTGGGKEMRVGDRALQITGPSELQTEAYQWQPASR
jgi:defect-in-organelle-trafficking protein DotC